MTLEQLGALLAGMHITHILRPNDDDILIAYPMKHYRGSDGQHDLMMRLSITEHQDLVRMEAFLEYGLSDVQVKLKQTLFRMLLLVAFRSPMLQFEMRASGAMFFVVEAPLRDGVITAEQLSLCIESVVGPVDQYDEDIRHSIRMGVSRLPVYESELHDMMTEMLNVHIREDDVDESEEESDEWI